MPKTKTTAKTRKGQKGESLWVQALKQHGYMQKGENFRPLPKKGTPEYKRVKKTLDALKKKKLG